MYQADDEEEESLLPKLLELIERDQRYDLINPDQMAKLKEFAEKEKAFTYICNNVSNIM